MTDTRVRVGGMLVAGTPYLMKFLSFAGTAAMFLVGGGILAHGIPALHHQIENMQLRLQQIEVMGGVLATASGMAAHALLGLLVGAAVLMVVHLIKSAKPQKKTIR